MRQFDSLPSMLENSTALYSQFIMDPIFTPLFAAIGFSTTPLFGMAGITAASVASAIATTSMTKGIMTK